MRRAVVVALSVDRGGDKTGGTGFEVVITMRFLFH
jgi:hypothetical protein